VTKQAPAWRAPAAAAAARVAALAAAARAAAVTAQAGGGDSFEGGRSLPVRLLFRVRTSLRAGLVSTWCVYILYAARSIPCVSDKLCGVWECVAPAPATRTRTFRVAALRIVFIMCTPPRRTTTVAVRSFQGEYIAVVRAARRRA
jgi:hypothetical protein